MKNNIIAIDCHDCGEESFLYDEYQDIEKEDIQYCPYCGSDNLEKL